MWSINQKFVKHKVAPNEGFAQAYSPVFPAPFVTDQVVLVYNVLEWKPICIFITLNSIIYTIHFIYYKISVSQAIKVKLVSEFKNELILFLFNLLHHYSIND